MEFKEIIAISGYPGLFKYVAQSKNGVIVESLTDGTRINATGNAKVSSLADIAIYTHKEEVPLADVYTAIFKKNSGKELVFDKNDTAALRSLLQEYLPEFDQERVYGSDIKKLFAWYNVLVGAGMKEFVIEKDEPETAEGEVDGTAKAAKSAKPEAKKTAPKTAKPAAAAKPSARPVTKGAAPKAPRVNKSGGN